MKETEMNCDWLYDLPAGLWRHMPEKHLYGQERCGEPAAHCGSAVQKLCYCGRQHLWQIWIFGWLTMFLALDSYVEAVWRRQDLHGRVLKEEGGQGYPGEYHC